ncbi:acetoin utilization deacetylase AcuC-like enzyme [Sphingomonas jejuensis]|uniref:Acetoin utilization deacetylase AcuC-like enzyme n=1 Tax=Sphingomonas jejuensis TaxID=904715 RepID=A0ABX0XJT9_9SPHN|nr:acetoin utilization deacetylase AcuC-like enzyme [Sphingomonas jejuensis]
MLHLVHHPDYVTPAPPGAFPADKYGLIIPALEEIGAPHKQHRPEPMPRRWIEAVHEPAYVEEVFTASVPRDKERRIGFPVDARIARRVQLTPGGSWLAARLALNHGYAANSAGGSHHALFDTGAGYCVFNDLAVAAIRLIAEGTVARILIVDLDVHQGDGTAALIGDRADIRTYSVHGEKNFPARKARSTVDVALPDGATDDAYLDALSQTLPPLVDRVRPDLILYQAGVDPHVDDRLGRLALSDEGLDRRDRFVAGEAIRSGAAVASALGGGYGPDKMLLARRHVRSMLCMADALKAHRPVLAARLGSVAAEVA